MDTGDPIKLAESDLYGIGGNCKSSFRLHPRPLGSPVTRKNDSTISEANLCYVN